jgi:L-lactate dehydrogenase (cytochrome)
VLHNGSEDPGGAAASLVKAGPAITGNARQRLLAAFNGGFKLSAGGGGYMQEGHVIGGLLRGYASLIIYRSGRARIAVWPSGSSGAYSVRQNLSPLVLHEKPTSAAYDWTVWGATLGGGAYVARSAIGENAAGDLIYAGSMSAVPIDLARALVRYGARTAMELDINPAWVQLDVASHAGGKLYAEVPGQYRPASQYLSGWTRDFFAVLTGLLISGTQCHNGFMASTKDWFETVEEARRRAVRRVPPSVALALVAGSEKGVTLQDNLDAFSEIRFRPPRIADLPASRALGTRVLGVDLSLPVIASPVGAQAVHPSGEVGVARGTAAAGTAMGLSSFASTPVEDVVAVNPSLFFQMYWCGDKDRLAYRVERAHAAGARALIVTLDWSFSNGRDWGSPAIPEKMDLRALLRFAPEGVRRPRYVLDWLRSGGLPDLTVPNMTGAAGEAPPTFFGAYGEWMSTPPPTWADIAWLRSLWDGPFLVKGIMRPDDARRAVDAGATAISVSNHGGNNLDSTPASIRALSLVAAAVGDQIEVLLDGGVRRGGDVVKALALGARAVFIGRAYLWGLAANGSKGVSNVFEVLRGGIDSTLLALGHSSVGELSPEDVILPEDFSRGLD